MLVVLSVVKWDETSPTHIECAAIFLRFKSRAHDSLLEGTGQTSPQENDTVFVRIQAALMIWEVRQLVCCLPSQSTRIELEDLSMNALLDDPASTASVAAARRLRGTTAAVRVCFTWLGVRKSLNPEQKSQAAESFGAERDYLSAGKKLLDTSHPPFKAVTGVRSRILSFWKGISLPYPEPGIRLIRQDDVRPFTQRMTTLKAELDEAVAQLDACYAELKSAARLRLGTLYNSADYPQSLIGWFDCTWDFPSVEPPSYLRQLSPELYEQEAARVAARFDEAVQLAEQAFVEELSKLVNHLTDRLSGNEDGKPKIFRDSAIENLQLFFDRFRHLNIRSSQQLDELVTLAQRTVKGVEAQQLRDNSDLRQQISTELSGVQSVLDGLLVDRPRRNILRRPK
jgi:hypothetical protein